MGHAARDERPPRTTNRAGPRYNPGAAGRLPAQARAHCNPSNRSRQHPESAPFELEDHVTGIWYFVGFAVAGVSFVFLTIGLSWLISHRIRGDAHKGYPYESGIDTYGDTHARFGISYYIYAMLFVAFDVEVIFIFLWALVFRDLLLLGFVAMGIFVLVLLLALLYAWRKGVLEWR
jgi:NADH:ubiquinone oxidoreductase subunit 3 (subunit A)